jgi:hypothetical protein
MKPSAANNIPDDAVSESIKAQREQALACFVLAISVSLAVVFSVFGKAPENDAARASAELHRKLDNESRLLLENTRASFSDMNKTLESMRGSASK